MKSNIYLMTNKLPHIIILLVLLSSCASKKDIIYALDNQPQNLEFKNAKINPGDILDIKVSALNPESVVMFNKTVTTNFNVQPEILKINGYLVDEDGQIYFPLIGDIKVVGLSTSGASDLIKEKLTNYVQNPTVTVRLVNYKVSVLGEVVRPGTYTFLEERISLPQVLGQAGDLTINGNRRRVDLLRYQNGELKTYHLDLTAGDLTNTDFYFMESNDVIYVQPNTAKVKSSGLIGNVGTVISVLSLILSLTIVLNR